MKIAGFFGGHDSSCCILQDGIIIAHYELERYYNREKEIQGDSVALFFDRYKDYDDIKYFVSCYPKNKLEAWPESYKKLQELIKKNDGELIYLSHHMSHCANSFYSSNLEKSLIISMDGGGVESEDNQHSACTFWIGEGTKLTHIKTFPINEVNIGGVWSRQVRYVHKLSAGWPDGDSAGSLLAKAALGNGSKYVPDFIKMLTTDIMQAAHKPTNHPRGAFTGYNPPHPYLDKWIKIGEQGEQEKYDLADGLQTATEKIIFSIIKILKSQYPEINNLCIGGGCALNTVAMGKLYDEFDFDNIYIPPTPSDSGLSIGSAQYYYHHILGNPRIIGQRNYSPYLGEQYSNDDIYTTLNKYEDQLTTSTVNIEYIVELLEEQNVISVFNGCSESGKRALGNRSILADPRKIEIKDKINNKIKNRENYRPFAPSVLREEVKNWFEYDIDSPYMQFVLRIKEDKQGLIPAANHVDGTARLQTVTEQDNKWYYGLLKLWHKQTNIPMLLNTSLNKKEPIVETPEDAIKCFLKTELDYLYFVETNTLVKRK
jgi:carbamoyltransferase